MPDPAMPVSTVEDWWARLRSSALVGTARRPVPPATAVGVTDRDGSAEERALDGAALGAALHRTGRLPDRAGPLDPAPEDRLPVAPARAVQLLDLLLDQPPAGVGNTDDLLQAWLEACAAAERRVPHARLPVLLGHGERAARLRGPLRTVIDQRGHWLATRNATWAWALGAAAPGAPGGAPDPGAWALLPDAERVTTLRRARYLDPDAGRALLLSTWAGDPARVRAAHLEALAVGLSAGDEEVLEDALGDRAASVRAVAADLLDGLPGSARARRMAERLRPLIRRSGLLGRSLEVDLPDEPDGAGLRDGLGAPPPGRSQRGWWLERLAAGAPFAVWDDDPATVVRRVHDQDVLAGLRRAAVRRHDPAWAEALLATLPDPRLVAVQPAARREQLVVSLLPATERPQLGRLLDAVPGPWSAAFSEAVLADVSRRTHPGGLLEDLPLRRLHPQVQGELERWLARLPTGSPAERALARSVRHLVQLHSLRHAISEAFDDRDD